MRKASCERLQWSSNDLESKHKYLLGVTKQFCYNTQFQLFTSAVTLKFLKLTWPLDRFHVNLGEQTNVVPYLLWRHSFPNLFK